MVVKKLTFTFLCLPVVLLPSCVRLYSVPVLPQMLPNSYLNFRPTFNPPSLHLKFWATFFNVFSLLIVLASSGAVGFFGYKIFQIAMKKMQEDSSK